MSDEQKVNGTPLEKPITTQEEFDAMIKPRIAREKERYSDYETTKQKLAEYERLNSEKTQKELEAQKEYEKLKEIHTKREQELTGLISQKDIAINDMKVTSSLMTEIIKQNAYAEETIALIKSQAVVDKEGNIRIKGRDANGLEVMDSVEEGLKKFLTQRPHLVKVSQKAGGGTGAGGTGNTGSGAADNDLNALNAEMQQAQNRGDVKKVNELKTKMRVLIAAQRTQL